MAKPLVPSKRSDASLERELKLEKQKGRVQIIMALIPLIPVLFFSGKAIGEQKSAGAIEKPVQEKPHEGLYVPVFFKVKRVNFSLPGRVQSYRIYLRILDNQLGIPIMAEASPLNNSITSGSYTVFLPASSETPPIPVEASIKAWGINRQELHFHDLNLSRPAPRVSLNDFKSAGGLQRSINVTLTLPFEEKSPDPSDPGVNGSIELELSEHQFL